jgi:arabinosaccharide transport system substrate-binding protein
MIVKFPYGKAPFWLFVIAIASLVLSLVTRRHKEPRPDLVFVTFTESHYEAYRKAVPEFEKKHGVTVQVQYSNWASLQTRLQNAMLAGTDVPDLSEMLEGSLGFFTRGPVEDFGILDLTDRLKRDGLDKRLVESRFSLWSARGRVYSLPHDVHPVMLAYRRDLIEKLGIDVSQLDTWDKFVEVGRRVTGDLDGDGVVDRYMLDLRMDGNWSLDTLMFQRGGQFFDPDGNITFNTEDNAQLIRWYIEQTRGPHRISYECGWGQAVAKTMMDGVVLFFWAPDWRSFVYADEVPSLKGKMALMPLPAWKEGGRRTSVWGGTGLMITKATKNPDLAWELAKFLYFDPAELGRRFKETNTIPVLKDAWDLPELSEPDPYYSNLPIGKMYAALAPDTPPVYSSPVDNIARNKLDEAFSRSAEYYESHGDSGLMEKIRDELGRAVIAVRRMADREKTLAKAKE